MKEKTLSAIPVKKGSSKEMDTTWEQFISRMGIVNSAGNLFRGCGND